MLKLVMLQKCTNYYVTYWYWTIEESRCGQEPEKHIRLSPKFPEPLWGSLTVQLLNGNTYNAFRNSQSTPYLTFS
jgi:hypothetical protein